LRWFGIAVFLYGLCFVVLWKGGGYLLTESGKVRSFMGIETGISVPDVAEWQPLFGHCQTEYSWPDGSVSPRCDLIGWIWYPFWVWVDARHPSVRLVDERGKIVPAPVWPPGFSVHPIRGKLLSQIERLPRQ
jgi:hypothetical protein